ncbi:MAG TPA: hypothetical protein PLP33_14545 [Leptospiraceae bacterium]|nr:hypothetical protein [Leptospiraceae bacterium]
MIFTKEFILEKIKDKDIKFFRDLMIGARLDIEGIIYKYSDYDSEFKEVYYQTYGDGNEFYTAFHFPEIDVYILITGTYSSWDSNSYDKVELAEPYEYTEIRYRPVNEKLQKL